VATSDASRVIVIYHGIDQVVADILYYFFFFRAEDGIRYRTVTGVQTCALPILIEQIRKLIVFAVIATIRCRISSRYRFEVIVLRSEERRVGKECRYGWWGCQL